MRLTAYLIRWGVLGITTTALEYSALWPQEVVRDYGRGPEVHSPSSLHSKASWIGIPRG